MTARATCGWVLAGWVAMLMGCGSPDPIASGEGVTPPAANARAVFDEARRELADAGRAPLRRGMEIDRDALHAALVDLRARHGVTLAEGYAASIEALPRGELPAAPQFSEVASFSLPDAAAARDVEAINWLFDEDVRHTVQRVVGTYLTLMMVEDVGMTTEQVGIWMAFLRAAKPELRRCGGQGSALSLCVDYGADVFVVDLVRQEPAWVATRLRWMQASAVRADDG
ncbi:hypothetical protein [Paraliomyxa miuraensis]|uniref:hypothetical protein n=1 Tax=Paraliomyxa miuraensis TaxID=376150 RepID=UPI00224DF16D|nr:hypothetical protein [Paraliomyxa miuraensis]MCX4244682.1 hypothetical protein [Paraliomyxa miuraensis]